MGKNWIKWCPNGCGRTVYPTNDKIDLYFFIYKCELCKWNGSLKQLDDFWKRGIK